MSMCRLLTLARFEMVFAVTKAIFVYLLWLHLAAIRPTVLSDWHEAASLLFDCAVLAGMKGVWLTDITL